MIQTRVWCKEKKECEEELRVAVLKNLRSSLRNSRNVQDYPDCELVRPVTVMVNRRDFSGGFNKYFYNNGAPLVCCRFHLLASLQLGSVLGGNY